MVSTNRYFGVVKEEPMVSDDPYPNKLRYIDIESDSMESDNQIQIAEGIAPDSRRQAPGGFKSGGSINAAADINTLGILLAAILGGTSGVEQGIDGVNPGPWEHVLYSSDTPPQYSFLIGREQAEHQLIGNVCNSVSFEIVGGEIQKITADWITTYERTYGTVKTSVTIDDEPLLPFHMNTILWDGVVVDAESIKISITNNRFDSAYQLSTRNFASRRVVDDCDTNASGWVGTGVTLADETTIKIFGAASLHMPWIATTSDGGTAVFTIVDEDWRKYDRIGFWYYQANASGSSSEDYEVKLTNNGTPQNAQTITPDNFDNAGWYYITIDISGLSRDDVEALTISAPGTVTDTMDMYIDHIEVWKHNRAPIQRREITVTIDKNFDDESDYQRFLGNTSATSPQNVLDTYALAVTTDTDILIDSANETFEYQLITHLPRLVLGKPGGPTVSGRDRLTQSLELTAIVDETPPTEMYSKTHSSAPTNWAIMFVIQNNWEVY